ncbi:hypothetical protein EVAR_57102_1 [Eumeta japonica]|uniref:CNH domain-containing protein n=1 Tax=Eumeta variegata TaxID=151549 RepID=A0A4C1YFP3_EUMVA|nr:hypothetical protein EVAR_57102_1 [Eumeta japonica]
MDDSIYDFERLEAKECRIAELEIQGAELEAIRNSSESQLAAAARRTRDLMEECAALRTRAHEHHTAVMRLQGQLAEAQEQVSAGKEAAEAAAACWRTREIRTDATLRQQSKLINLLQAKLEEANRKKCSLSKKLFGRSGRRPMVSPPLQKTNKELREEVERLRGRLAVTHDPMPAHTPKGDTAKKQTNGVQSIDMPDSTKHEPLKDESLQLVWPDSKREKIHATIEDGALLCSREKGGKIQAHLISPMPKACGLTQQEAQRAFTIRMEQESNPAEATAVCSSTEQRECLLSRLNATLSYSPQRLLALKTPPACAQSLAQQAVAIGCADGLHSLRGTVQLEWAPCAGGETGEAGYGAVTASAVAGGRVLFVRDGMLLHAAYTTMASALKRSESLRPVVDVSRVDLPDTGSVQLLHAINEEIPHGDACVAVATGRRVHVLCWDAAALNFKVLRSLTVDRPPHSLLLTNKALYIAGEKPFRVSLPNGTLETFGLHEPTIQAAAKKHSPPKAILLIRENPVEVLICYNECGIFVDKNGKRTRTEDAKWRNRVSQWAFSHPFLYNVSKDSITIIHINEEAYNAPPCTCDARSLTSNSSDCTAPECFRINVEDSALLGTTAEGVFLRSREGDEYNVLLVEGLLAMRSVGASVMSLDSVSLGALNSSTSSDESGEVKTEVVAVIEHDVSMENEPRTAFQADIKRRAAQLRKRQAEEAAAKEAKERRAIGDAITEILSSDVGPKKAESSASLSGFSSDTESDGKTYSIKSSNDLCAEMFARQVRFQ